MVESGCEVVSGEVAAELGAIEPGKLCVCICRCVRACVRAVRFD